MISEGSDRGGDHRSRHQAVRGESPGTASFRSSSLLEWTGRERDVRSAGWGHPQRTSAGLRPAASRSSMDLHRGRRATEQHSHLQDRCSFVCFCPWSGFSIQINPEDRPSKQNIPAGVVVDSPQLTGPAKQQFLLNSPTTRQVCEQIHKIHLLRICNDFSVQSYKLCHFK